MGIKVAKFGGSSVADAIQLAKTKDIILADPERRYVVVSAPGKRYNEDNKITDLLYLLKTHMEHNLPYEQVFQVICDRFTAMALNLGAQVDLTKEFATIIEKMRAGASADYIASRGEYLNAMITAAYLGFDFVDAAVMVHFDENGKFLFCGSDIAKALGYTNPNKAINDHCRAITKRSTPISGKVQSINFIPE